MKGDTKCGNVVVWGSYGQPGKKIEFCHTRYRALSQELIPVYRQSVRR